MIWALLIMLAVLLVVIEWASRMQPVESIRAAIRDENLHRLHRAQLNTRPIYTARSQEAIVR